MIGARFGARLWWGFAPLLVLLWGTGALAPSVIPGIPTAPLLTQVAAPSVAYAQDIALALAIGSLVTMLWSSTPRVRRWAAAWVVVGIGLVVMSAATLQSDVTTRQIGLDASGLTTLLGESAVGRAILVQVACLVVAVGLIWLGSTVHRPWPTWGAVMLVAMSVAAPAVAGHAGLSSEHQVAGVVTGLHAVAISLWVGGLAAVSARCLMDTGEAAVLLPRFSLLALVCVIAAAETGLLSASLTLGALSDFAGSTYGSLIIAKAVTLAWLVWFGWLQRRRALDRLPDASVPGTIARLAAIELTLMAAAIAAAVVLVRIGPPPIPMEGLAPLTVVALGIAGPMLMAEVRPAGWRVANAWPEASMVVLLLVLVETGGVGLFRSLLGTLGLVIELVVMVVVGWLALAAARNSIPAIVLGMMGLPAALVANAVLSEAASWRMTMIAALVGEAVLVLGWLHAHRPRTVRAKADVVMAP